jgi:hypothetical protein
MAGRRKPPEVKIYTACGTVLMSTLRKLQREVTPTRPLSRVIGDILETWGRSKPEVKIEKDERQEELDL